MKHNMAGAGAGAGSCTEITTSDRYWLFDISYPNGGFADIITTNNQSHKIVDFICDEYSHAHDSHSSYSSHSSYAHDSHSSYSSYAHDSHSSYPSYSSYAHDSHPSYAHDSKSAFIFPYLYVYDSMDSVIYSIISELSSSSGNSIIKLYPYTHADNGHNGLLMNRSYDNVQNRYWIFAFTMKTPHGGLDDIISSYNSYECAISVAKKCYRHYDDIYVYDKHTHIELSIDFDFE